MNIIICGAGRVGYSICSQLSKQGHSVTVIDKNGPDIQNINDNLDHMFIQLFESLGGEYEAMNFFKKTIEEEWVANDNEWRNNWIGVLIGIIVVSVVEKEDVSVEGFEFLQDKNIIDELGNMIESPENPFNFINEYLENNFPEQLIDAMDY